MDRLATAPISWGICEVPGWGIQLPVDRVLREMSDLGFPATELGSEGYLPEDPDELTDLLAKYDLRLLAAFVPLVVHDEAEIDETLRRTERTAALLAAAGAEYFNTAPVMTWDWGERHPRTADEWALTMTMLGRVGEIVDNHGLTQVLHSHVGVAIETRDEVQRVLDESDVQFVLDTAHLAVGGFDPVEFARDHTDRVGLVHIKDADMAIAARLNAGELTLMEAVQTGIFPTVGQGDLDIDGVIGALERSGYSGWYVLEQDVAIVGDEPGDGEGPVLAVRASVDHLRHLEARLAAGHSGP